MTNLHDLHARYMAGEPLLTLVAEAGLPHRKALTNQFRAAGLEIKANQIGQPADPMKDPFRKAIITLASEGTSIREICRRLHMSFRRVRRVLETASSDETRKVERAPEPPRPRNHHHGIDIPPAKRSGNGRSKRTKGQERCRDAMRRSLGEHHRSKAAAKHVQTHDRESLRALCEQAYQQGQVQRIEQGVDWRPEDLGVTEDELRQRGLYAGQERW